MPEPHPNESSPHGPPLPWQAPILDVALALARERLAVALLLVVGLVVTTTFYFRTPRTYRASAVAVLLPREKPSLDASINAGSVEVTDASASRSESGVLMLPPNTDLYFELLTSRPVLEAVAAKHMEELASAHGVQRSDESVATLRDMTIITGTEEGLLTIVVTAHSPQLASAIANDLIAECEDASRLIERQLVLQQAGHLQQAVRDAGEQVSAAERDLRAFGERHCVFDPAVEGGESIRLVRETATAKESIDAKIEGLLASRTERDPEVQRLRSEAAAHENRLRELRAALGASEGSVSSLVVEHEGLKQRLRFRRDLLSSLTSQADLFRIRAEQPAGNIAVVRAATPVDIPAGPSKKRIFGLGLVASIVGAAGAALAIGQWRHIVRDPLLADRVATLRASIELRPHALAAWKRARLGHSGVGATDADP